MPWERIRSALAAPPARREAAPTAAVALVLTKDFQLLLIRRAEHPRDPWSGQMALPGGSRDAGDSSFLDTARRETLEETGIDLSGAEFLGELDDLAPRTPSLPPVIVRPFVFGLSARVAVRPSDEVAGHLWVGLEKLKASAGAAEVKFRGETHRVGAYLASDPPVWGMTHRILSGFLTRVL
ncbi:MAG: CoA pyrophosphatase [Elusimicrobia bacterium]|nr:CoA pyrophosphatase [Elusimicrobiota bacterium]